ncbi:MAG: hypothetical protein EXS49_02290 [Candidatus Pacebacteria bacterium]|nr:hypothetical protein [Candidatus Paceibacterota bacterium]
MKKSMKYSFFALLLVVSFFVSSIAFASEESSEGENSPTEEVSSAGILPTNPFHFMKEFRWGFKRFFSNSPFRKFGLEEQIQINAVLEISKMISMKIDNPSAIEKSVLAFKESLNNMKEISSSLTEKNMSELSDSVSRLKNSWMRLRRLISSGKIEVDGVSDMYSEMSEILSNFSY